MDKNSESLFAPFSVIGSAIGSSYGDSSGKSTPCITPYKNRERTGSWFGFAKNEIN